MAMKLFWAAAVLTVAMWWIWVANPYCADADPVMGEAMLDRCEANNWWGSARHVCGNAAIELACRRWARWP